MTPPAATLPRLTFRQLRYEQLVYWRTPVAVFFTMAMPVLLLVVFASLNGDEPVDEAHGIRFAQYFVPGMVAFGLASATYGNLASRFVFRREVGALKRLRSTPLPATALVGGFIANAVVAVAVVTAVVVGAGIVLYDVTVARWGALALTLVVGAAAFSALGMAVANAISNTDTADAVIFGTLMPLLFTSGAFNPIPPDSLMANIANLFPVRHLVLAMISAFDVTGSTPAVEWAHLAWVAAWGVAGVVLAVRFFRWHPSSH